MNDQQVLIARLREQFGDVDTSVAAAALDRIREATAAEPQEHGRLRWIRRIGGPREAIIRRSAALMATGATVAALVAGTAHVGSDTPAIDGPVAGAFARTTDPPSQLDWSAPAISLLDGRVLALGSGQLVTWDPRTELFVSETSLPEAHEGGVLSRLRDGRVLIAGGYLGTSPATPIDTAYVWDPGTGEAIATGSLLAPRAGGLSVTLADGRVLVVGGLDNEAPEDDPMFRPGPEVWDPATGVFMPFAVETRIAMFRTLSVLDDGMVLVFGSTSDDCGCAELWDPVAMTAVPVGSLPVGYGATSASALSDGRVLVIATRAALPGVALLWDRESRRIDAAGSLANARWMGTATLLLDGRVLVAGGRGADGSTITDAEIWDPRVNGFVPTGPMVEARIWAPTALAGDGRVLMVGGRTVTYHGDTGDVEILDSAEAFTP